jgi:hypothetical protein
MTEELEWGVAINGALGWYIEKAEHGHAQAYRWITITGMSDHPLQHVLVSRPVSPWTDAAGTVYPPQGKSA